MNALEIKDLHVRINQAHILHGVNFTAPQHQVTALLGRNGVGKSTTLKAIMGLYAPTGSVRLNGEELLGKQTHWIAAHGVAYIPEDREIFASLTVKENLALASRSRHSEEKILFIYQLFPIFLLAGPSVPELYRADNSRCSRSHELYSMKTIFSWLTSRLRALRRNL